MRHLAGVAVIAAAAITLSACATSTPAASSVDASSVDASTATSAEDFGGMDALIAAAKAEGQLNVIALPDNWANYGEIKALFEKKYGITVNSADPDISSAEEIAAADNLKGQDTAPDVFDLGTAVTLDSLDYFAPYKVANWDEIPAGNKPLRQRLHRQHVDRLRLQVGAEADEPRRPARVEIQGCCRPQRRPDTGWRCVCCAGARHRAAGRNARRFHARHRVLPEAEHGRQLPSR